MLADASKIIESAQRTAYRAVDYVLVQRNWYLGRRITEELIGDQTREDMYGKSLVQNLAKELTAAYGKGFDFSSLYKYIRFYQYFPNILDTASPKSFLLDWSHLCLPSEEELRREIERQKEIYQMQHDNTK